MGHPRSRAPRLPTGFSWFWVPAHEQRQLLPGDVVVGDRKLLAQRIVVDDLPPGTVIGSESELMGGLAASYEPARAGA